MIFNWIDAPFDKGWLFYLIALFMWMSILGLQCLAQLVVADLMPKRKVDIKLARCYGAYVLIFGLGFLSNVVLFQIFLNSGDVETR